ncbi:helix-turn-helix domain-containing protein [Photorhabdus asymbiotica]|uniref:helix-turn-helix domain-containing protein n=1 Tax=Photorhabdus asymbiotica TaxID=291112 RepID=UPI003DA7973F
MNKQYTSVWDALEDTQQAAENMKVRSQLARALSAHIKKKGLNQTEAAKLLNVTQPRVSDLINGKINLFSIDTLINMIVTMGLHISNIEISEEIAA